MKESPVDSIKPIALPVQRAAFFDLPVQADLLAMTIDRRPRCTLLQPCGFGEFARDRHVFCEHVLLSSRRLKLVLHFCASSI
jgi:hypothetical protein